MSRNLRLTAAGVACAASLAAVPIASAHQTTVSNGIRVTMHISPDDAPVAGQRATLILVSAKRRGWRLVRSRCGCRVTVRSSSGTRVLNRRFSSRSVGFTFPRSGAYRITFAGRVVRGSRTRRFNASFAYRAS